MYVSMPVLAAMAFAFIVLAALAFRRRGGERDLMAPPRQGSSGRSSLSQLPGIGPAGSVPVADLPAEVADQVRALSAAGRKIDAIRLVRKQTGLGLVEAKSLVERM
jgi:large subunit ribosomal protein L7/L12